MSRDLTFAEKAAPYLKLQERKMPWHVFPVAFGRKRPLIKDYYNMASCDPNQIDAWDSKFRNADICKVTGAMSGTLVLDLDGPEAEERVQEQARRGNPLPRTVEAVSGREEGGRHLYFHHVKGVPSQAGTKALWGCIDVMSDKKTIILPPSTHESGKKYQWVPGHAPWEMPMAALPIAWLRILAPKKKLLSQRATPKPRDRNPEWYTPKIEELIRQIRETSDHRNDTLFTKGIAAFCYFFEGELDRHNRISINELRQDLYDAAKSTGLSHGEIKTTIKSSYKYARQKVGA